jgi:hypothetical protein
MTAQEKIASIAEYGSFDDFVLHIENEGMSLRYDIGGRGGHVGVSREDFISWLGLEDEIAWCLPGKIGAYCNYLGGGLRGGIGTSTYSDKLPEDIAKLVDAFTDVCRNAYLCAEDEMNMNDEYDEDGDTNWEAVETNAARAAGITSAY